MAKAEPLVSDDLIPVVKAPKAATKQRGTLAPSQEELDRAHAALQEDEKKVPLQVRLPKDEARRIRVAAAERDEPISEFVAMCVREWFDRNRA